MFAFNLKRIVPKRLGFEGKVFNKKKAKIASGHSKIVIKEEVSLFYSRPNSFDQALIGEEVLKSVKDELRKNSHCELNLNLAIISIFYQLAYGSERLDVNMFEIQMSFLQYTQSPFVFEEKFSKSKVLDQSFRAQNGSFTMQWNFEMLHFMKRPFLFIE
ncbi:hypothetical protein EGR_04300 [Echinococcus granulosus]|uniref:Uncharacterized protein n=1 Tax=Echinococcus granulosus TaxID=6210 RepID=W6UID8_ECHGR|nr:hypothetical protein EGR_04300 [Echinococcus granulosus]EUB60861.1 hypothetical protein EGR_04300 [Echinococcus granulosus]